MKNPVSPSGVFVLVFVKVGLFFVLAEGFSTKYFPDDEPSVLFLVFGKL